MSSPAIATVIQMMESLPEDIQYKVAKHLREYLEDLQDELKGDNSFNKTQQKLITSAQHTEREITESQHLSDEKLKLWESKVQFRQELIEEGIEINPDEVWQNNRDYSPEREHLHF